jgi:hypothetical protein
MPGILNEDDLSALAAEYVIGTLDPDERARANALLDLDEGFRALVRAWERRLGELHLMVEPVEPDGQIWDRIRDRLGVRAPAPPPFAPQVAATPTLAPAPISAALSASAFSAPIAPSALEPGLESKPELVPQAPLSPPPFSLPQSFSQPPSQPPFPQPGQRTPEQELASLIAEADKFTTQLTELAGGPARAEQDSAPTEPSGEAALHAESLLAEAADAIATKPVEPHEVEHVEEELWPEQSDAIQDLPPPIRATGPRNDGTMLLSPTDVARITVQRQQRRIGRWRAAALLMTFLVLGLGSLIAAWRFAPDHLPQQLQPIAVLGLGEWSPSERIPAEHGTQFEE